MCSLEELVTSEILFFFSAVTEYNKLAPDIRNSSSEGILPNILLKFIRPFAGKTYKTKVVDETKRRFQTLARTHI